MTLKSPKCDAISCEYGRKISNNRFLSLSLEFLLNIKEGCVCCRTILQRVLPAYVESMPGVAGAEDPEWSGDQL